MGKSLIKKMNDVKRINLFISLISLLILSLLVLSLSGCSKNADTEKNAGTPTTPQADTQVPQTAPQAAAPNPPVKTEAEPRQPPIFSMKVYYGDEQGNFMGDVFAGDQEVGNYYLWIKNIGTYNASCTVTSNEEDAASKTVTSKDRYRVFLAPGKNDSRLYTFNGFKAASNELPDTIKCVGEGINKVQNEKPTINKFFWKRYFVEGGDIENPNDLAKKIDVGGNITIAQHGFVYDFSVVENTQNGNCTIKYQYGKQMLEPYKTVMIRDVKVTLMESRFKYCAILFW